MPIPYEKLADMIVRERDRFNALTPEEQAAERRENMIGFVYGQLQLDGISLTRDQVAAIYDRKHAQE